MLRLKVTVVCYQSIAILWHVQQIERTIQVCTELQMFSTDGFHWKAFFPEFFVLA